MKNLSKLTTYWLLENDIISDSEANLYIYSLSYLEDIAEYVLILITAGILTNQIFSGMALAFTTIILRSFGGGGHASNPIICNILSYTQDIVILSVVPLYSIMNLKIC